MPNLGAIVLDMSNPMTTAQAAEALGITRRAVVARVERGALVPALRLPGRTGAYLFDAEQIERAATVKRSEAVAR